jgi:hypothetical protein
LLLGVPLLGDALRLLGLLANGVHLLLHLLILERAVPTLMRKRRRRHAHTKRMHQRLPHMAEGRGVAESMIAAAHLMSSGQWTRFLLGSQVFWSSG